MDEWHRTALRARAERASLARSRLDTVLDTALNTALTNALRLDTALRPVPDWAVPSSTRHYYRVVTTTTATDIF